MANAEFYENIVSSMSDQVSGLGVRLDVNDLMRWIRALTKVEYRANIVIEDEMQRTCAQELSGNIYNAIQSGKYTNYPAYTDRYARWKEQYFSDRRFWELKGDLAEALQAFSVAKAGRGRDWVAGVPNGIMDSGGKSWLGDGSGSDHQKEIAMYGAVNEEKRPLFGPETREYIPSWKIHAGSALIRIGREFT